MSQNDFHLQFRPHFRVLLLKNDLEHPLHGGSFILSKERRPAVSVPPSKEKGKKKLSGPSMQSERGQTDRGVNGIDINLTECYLTCEGIVSS